MRIEWKDCIGWKKEGLELSTPSNQAAKLFDAALTQYAGFYDDPVLGGLDSTLEKLHSADPEFIMGRVIDNGLTLLSSIKTPRTDPSFREELQLLKVKVRDQSRRGLLTQREELHAEALLFVGEGQNKKACDIWQDILVQHPTDMLALKFLQDRCFYLGDSRHRVREVFERVRPQWSPRRQALYPQFLTVYSFSLFEAEDYASSEKVALESLALDRRQSWPIHSLAHCMEMTCRPDDGLTYIERTSNDWSPTSSVSCHLWWHAALFFIEKGDYRSALELYDEEVEKVARSRGSPFNVDDAASLLYRLQLEGVNVNNRWAPLYDVAKPYSGDHMLPFHDIHLCLSLLYGGNASCQTGLKNDNQGRGADEFIESMKDFIHSPTPNTDHRSADVGLAVCEALRAFQNGDYTLAADLILPHEWRIVHLGGSDAQLDLINQMMIHTAMRSNSVRHRRTARRLLVERKTKRPNSSLTDRLLAKAMLTSNDLDI